MTDVRPEHDAAGGGGEGSPWFRAEQPPRQQAAPGAVPEPQEWRPEPYGTPAAPVTEPYTAPYGAYGTQEAYGGQSAPQDPYAAPQSPYQAAPAPHPAAPGAAPVPHPSAPGPQPYEAAPRPYETAQSYPAGSDAYAAPQPYAEPGPYERPYAVADTPAPAPADTPASGAGSTAVLPVIDPATPAPGGAGGPTTGRPADAPAPEAADGQTPGGRAERRRAAKGRGGRRRAPGAPPPAAPATGSPSGAPLSRVEARRAARAAKESFGVIVSRVMGEIFITFGVVMLLFVAYQLWWTNVQAGLEVDKAKDRIAQDWAKDDADRKPGVFEAGEGFAILHIPKLDVVVPVAEGIDKEKVLDKGMAGHYAEGALKTAMPSDKQGNFAVAGHRNTHGEPFRYINQLKPGDPIVVETREAYYTYEMASILPQTPPSNVSVLKPIPDGSGFTEPGRYITLTTCTPEFTSTYRMIVWGKMVEERPRSKGVPDALAG
ncbi:class E sortase [Streptomyces sp. NPDC101145]|uniref:class E sortase n=1 Tax=Streptomyces sp. NPDC101145 TaxID=3366112 RepID=UPI00380BD8E6